MQLKQKQYVILYRELINPLPNFIDIVTEMIMTESLQLKVEVAFCVKAIDTPALLLTG